MASFLTLTSVVTKSAFCLMRDRMTDSIFGFSSAFVSLHPLHEANESTASSAPIYINMCKCFMPFFSFARQRYEKMTEPQNYIRADSKDSCSFYLAIHPFFRTFALEI
jgi:hypothetical protein